MGKNYNLTAMFWKRVNCLLFEKRCWGFFETDAQRWIFSGIMAFYTALNVMEFPCEDKCEVMDLGKTMPVLPIKRWAEHNYAEDGT